MTQNAIIVAFLAFCRIGACFMLMPGYSSVRIPMQVRLFTAIAVSLGMLTFLWQRIYPYVVNGQGTAKEALDTLTEDWKATFAKYGRGQ